MTTTMGSGRGRATQRVANGVPGLGGDAREHKSTLGRIGLVGKGVLYGVMGILAVQLATGDAAQADEKGAVGWIAAQPMGRVLLVAFTVSLFALALWRLIEVVTGDPVEGDDAKERIKFAFSGVAYLALAVFALTVTMAEWSTEGGGNGSSGASTTQKATATVLEWPGGRWIVGLAGLAVIAGAIYVVKHHVVDKTFAERLRVSPDHWSVPLGRAGYGARSVAYSIIGWFLVQSALSYDPQQAKGLSASLQDLSGKGWGQAVLWFVAVGLIAFGVYCFAESYYRRSA